MFKSFLTQGSCFWVVLDIWFMYLGRFLHRVHTFDYFGLNLRDKSPLIRFGKFCKEFVKEINTKFASF